MNITNFLQQDGWGFMLGSGYKYPDDESYPHLHFSLKDVTTSTNITSYNDLTANNFSKINFLVISYNKKGVSNKNFIREGTVWNKGYWDKITDEINPPDRRGQIKAMLSKFKVS